MTTLNKYKDCPDYNPARLLDFVRQYLGLKNDAALARALDLTPPQICKMRDGTNAIGGDVLIRMHDATGMTINTLRTHLGVPTVAMPVPAEA